MLYIHMMNITSYSEFSQKPQRISLEKPTPKYCEQDFIYQWKKKLVWTVQENPKYTPQKVPIVGPKSGKTSQFIKSFGSLSKSHDRVAYQVVFGTLSHRYSVVFWKVNVKKGFR